MISKLKEIPDLVWAFFLLLLLFVAYRIWHESWIGNAINMDCGALLAFFTRQLAHSPGPQEQTATASVVMEQSSADTVTKTVTKP